MKTTTQQRFYHTLKNTCKNIYCLTTGKTAPAFTYCTFRHGALLLTLLSGFTLLGCAESPENQPLKTQSYLLQGQSYFAQGQYKAAMIEAQNTLQNDPGNVDAHILIAQIYNVIGNSKQAIKQLRYITADQSNAYVLTLAEAYILRKKFDSSKRLLLDRPALKHTAIEQYTLLLAKAYIGLQQVAQAVALYQQLLSEYPANEQALLALASIDIGNNQYKDAEEKISQVSQAHPDSPQPYIFRAQLALLNDDLSQAEDFLTQSISKLPYTDIMTPLRSKVIRALSAILTKQGRSGEALVYTKLLSEAFPLARDLQTQYQEAIALYKEGKLDAAEKVLEDILAQVPENEIANQLLGIVNYLQGDFDQADRYLNDNIDSEIASTATKQVFALTNLQLNKPEKVLAFLEKDIASNQNVQMLSLYGLAALSSGKFSAGKQTLNKALALDPSKARLRLALARYHNSQTPAQLNQALKEIQKAYTDQPQDPWIQSALLQQLAAMHLEKQAQRIVNDIQNRPGKQSITHQILGDYYAAIGSYEKAKQQLDTAIERAPDDGRALHKAARNAVLMRNWEAAQSYLNAAIKLLPTQRRPYKDLISVYQQQGKVEEGVDKLTFLEKTSSADNYAPAAVLSEYYARVDDIDKAEVFLEKALQKAPNPKVLNKLGASVYLAAGAVDWSGKQVASARENIFKGLNYRHNDINLLNLLAQVEMTSGQYSEARKVIDQIRQYHPESSIAEVLTGDLEQLRNNQSKALAAYKEGWHKSYSDLTGRAIHGFLTKLQRHQEASDFLQQWTQNLPNSVEPLMIMAMKLQQTKQPAAAIPYYEQILAIDPNYSAAINNLAWLYHQADDPRALNLAQKAYQIAPSSGAVTDTYGWILFNNGRLKQAVNILEKAVALEPENKEIAKHLEIAQSSHPAP